MKGKKYDAYMCNGLWKEFVSDMKDNYPAAYKAYYYCQGGELKETHYPPKMASYGSSSHFIYKLSRDIPNFEFEKPQKTRIGGTANLDGYCKLEQTDIYVEAKCREIYPVHYFDVKNCYIAVYEYLEENSTLFRFKIIETNDKEKKKKVKFYYNEVEIKYFDMKQIICHFLGIINELPCDYQRNIRFLYLIYNPKDLTAIENKVTTTQITNIKKRYEEAIKQTKLIDYMELFKLIWCYQGRDINKIPHFQCKVVDQNTYRQEFK